jgi:endonuclease-3 related protein
MSMTLLEIYQSLRDLYGHRGGWPGETTDEIIIGAILTQNVTWKNVEKALHKLKENELLSMLEIYHTPAERIAPLIIPTRYYNMKAQRLKNFASFFHDEYSFSYPKMFNVDTATLRKQLLQIKGIGRETADSILLYAGGKLQFVTDAYTARLLGRLGFFTGKLTYDEQVARIVEQIPADVDLYQDMHAQIVHFSATVCKAKPLCGECVLRRSCASPSARC